MGKSKDRPTSPPPPRAGFERCGKLMQSIPFAMPEIRRIAKRQACIDRLMAEMSVEQQAAAREMAITTFLDLESACRRVMGLAV